MTSNFEKSVNAIISGNEEKLRSLIEQEPDLIHARSLSDHKCCLLHYLAANGIETELQKTPPNAVNIMRILLDKGAEVDAIANTYGGGNEMTTLFLLVTSTHPAQAGVQADLVRVLADYGANINGLNNNGMPLYGALSNGYIDTAKVIVECGGRVDNICFAAGMGDIQGVCSMFNGYALNKSARSDSYICDNDVSSDEDLINLAFSYGCHNSQVEVIKFLLEKKADINNTLNGLNVACTPLHMAVSSDNSEMVKFLVENGADINIEDDDHKSTALDWAQYLRKEDIYQYLLQYQ